MTTDFNKLALDEASDDDEAALGAAFADLTQAVTAAATAFTAETGQTIATLNPILINRAPLKFHVDVYLGPDLAAARLSQVSPETVAHKTAADWLRRYTSALFTQLTVTTTDDDQPQPTFEQCAADLLRQLGWQNDV